MDIASRLNLTADICKVSAFIDRKQGFKGNQAAVALLEEWPEDQVLQEVASIIGLPETAFLIRGDHPEEFGLRWFTPEIEMDLCGHATLAAAYFVFYLTNARPAQLTFETRSGDLHVFMQGEQIVLDFPCREASRCQLPDVIIRGLGKTPSEAFKSRDYMLVYEDEDDVRAMTPNRAILDEINLDPGGIIITAKGRRSDFVSRYFTPQASIFEDPVTGSAHCTLIPYWSRKLEKKVLVGHQLSAEGGALFCTSQDSRVHIAGNCHVDGILRL